MTNCAACRARQKRIDSLKKEVQRLEAQIARLEQGMQIQRDLADLSAKALGRVRYIASTLPAGHRDLTLDLLQALLLF